MAILDHSHTKVILIGNSRYENWTDGTIANVKVNLEQLYGVLNNPDLIGIGNPANILQLADCNKIDIELKVEEFAKNCSPSDTLVIYYAGHGLLDIKDLTKLYLATADTRIDQKRITCISIDELRTSLSDCKASNKVMILDCCYAAKAVKNKIMADIESLRGSHWASIEGVYYIMSSDEDEPSRFDPKDETIPTFFTQRLIQTISEGANSDKDIWSLDDLFDMMGQTWNTDIAPKPIKLSFKEIGKLPFCYNCYKKRLPGKAIANPDEEKWKEIELNPTEENISQFIRICRDPEVKRKAINFWAKMNNDWQLLSQAIKEGTFEALQKFVLDCDPAKPILDIAMDNMEKIARENRNRVRPLNYTAKFFKTASKPGSGTWSNQ